MCPDGVPMVALGEVCDIKNGKDYKHLSPGNIPVWGTGGIMTYVDQYAYNGPSVLLPRKGSIDKVYYSEGPVWTVDTLFYTIINESKIKPKYLYAVISMQDLRALDTSKGNRPSLTQTVLNKIQIPLPPLPIQQRIVEILDKFTSLVSSLDSEIVLRQKQYEYYRNKLLSFEEGEEGVEWKKIGDMTRVFSASRVHKNEWKESGVPFFRSSDVMSAYNGVDNNHGKAYISYDLYEKLSAKSGKIHKDDVLVTGGGSIGMPYIVPTDEPLYVKDADLLCIVKNDNFISKYLYHIMFTKWFRSYLNKITHDASIPHYTISQIIVTPIPIVSKDRQLSIVRTLDTFESLLTNLKKERELRQKQYEYYREKLLTFA